VAVLENDDDPDGTKSDLTVTLGAGGKNARVGADGTVRVQVTDQRQLITYTVTDPTASDSPSSGAGAVGAAAEPHLHQAGRGQERRDDLFRCRSTCAAGGKSVVITEAAKVSAVHANGASLIKDQQTRLHVGRPLLRLDALTFEVTDGDGPDDPTGRRPR
jgi:hypothetical protein